MAAWDPTRLALWIHGGFQGTAYQDLWRFDTLSSIWELLEDRGPSRYSHVGFWDAGTSSFWIQGGYDDKLCQDLWRFDDARQFDTESKVSSTSTRSSSSTTSFIKSTLRHSAARTHASASSWSGLFDRSAPALATKIRRMTAGHSSTTTSTQTLSTSTTSFTTSTSTVEGDATALLVLCPLLGVATVVLFGVAMAWIVKISRCGKIMVIRMPRHVSSRLVVNTQLLLEPASPPKIPSLPQLELQPPKLKPSGTNPTPHRILAFQDLPLCIDIKDPAPPQPTVLPPLRADPARRDLAPTRLAPELHTPMTLVPSKRRLASEPLVSYAAEPQICSVPPSGSPALWLHVPELLRCPVREWHGILRMRPVQLPVSSLYSRPTSGPSLRPAGREGSRHLDQSRGARLPKEVLLLMDLLQGRETGVRMANAGSRAQLPDFKAGEPPEKPLPNCAVAFCPVGLRARGSPRPQLPTRTPSPSPILAQSIARPHLALRQLIASKCPTSARARLPDPTEHPPAMQRPAVAGRPRFVQAMRSQRRHRRERAPFYDPEDPNVFGRIPGLVFGFPSRRRHYSR